LELFLDLSFSLLLSLSILYFFLWSFFSACFLIWLFLFQSKIKEELLGAPTNEKKIINVKILHLAGKEEQQRAIEEHSYSNETYSIKQNQSGILLRNKGNNETIFYPFSAVLKISTEISTKK
jgi:hypothetical protein